MGRVRRQRRYKACDPFSKQKSSDDMFDLPPKRKDTEDKHFMETKSYQYFQDKIERGGKKKIEKRKSELVKDARHVHGAKPKKAQKTKSTDMPSMEKLPNESRKKYFSRLDHNVQLAINSVMKESKSIRKKRKDHLKSRDEKKKKQKVDQGEIKDFKSLQDNVKFGEVVEAPPQISAFPRNAAKDKKTSDLKLMSLLRTDTEHKKGDIKRRKEMSSCEKQLFDEKRERAITAYRVIKKRKEAIREYRSFQA